MLLETTARAAEIVGAHQATTSLTVDGDAVGLITVTHNSGDPRGSVMRGEGPRSGDAAADVCRMELGRSA